MWIVEGDHDAVEAMPPGKVEHLPLMTFTGLQIFGEKLGRRRHHRRHAARELDPDRVLGSHRARVGVGCTPLAHYPGKVLPSLGSNGREQVSDGAAEVRGGTTVEKNG